MPERTAGGADVRTPGDRSPRRRRPVLPGLLVLALGIVFLLDNLDVIEGGRLFRFWPLILVAAGIRILWRGRDRGAALGGALLAGAGALLLLDSLSVVNFNVLDLWPLILVAVGLRMLAFPRSAPHHSAEAVENCSAFLGGVERRSRAADYRGGAASAFLGAVNLDLTGADMAGDRAVLRVSVMMGGVGIRIPEAWTVEVGFTPVLGSVEDRTRGADGAAKRLVLEGSVLMGGVEIRN